MLEVRVTGFPGKTESWLDKLAKGQGIRARLDGFGRAGVEALSAATPVDSGLTAHSWGYEIKESANSWTINWTNSHIVAGVPIAVILQYGHGTGTGGYVPGEDYINPALRPIFKQIADEAWKVVTSA